MFIIIRFIFAQPYILDELSDPHVIGMHGLQQSASDSDGYNMPNSLETV